MASPLLSARIPQELMDAIDANSEATKRSRTDVVVAILDGYFNPSPEDELAHIRRRLELVERRLEATDS